MSGPGPTTATVPADALRRYGSAAPSALQGHLARALAGSEAAVQALGAAAPRRLRPAVLLAALHDLALAGRAGDLAAALTAGDHEAAAAAALDLLRERAAEVVVSASRYPLLADETGRHTVLHPAVAEVARRLGADRVGLVSLGRAAGFDLDVDRVYLDLGGRTVGEPCSPVRLTATVVGGRPVPATPLPAVVARVVLAPHVVDVGDPDVTRWLRACVPPDQPGRQAELDAEITVARAAPRLLLRDDAVGGLATAIRAVPADALPVLTTTWSLARLAPAARARFRDRLVELGAARPLAWVSVEGVGVAPGVPTLGDRPASGHSTIGLTVCDGSGARAEAVGRCWSRGRTLSWLAG